MYDFGGIDLAAIVMEYFTDEFRNNQYATPQVVKQMIGAGKLGRKSGEGFYKY
ncbi:MAG: 3-hydroxyacyl-CoA dehydrogenase family protein [Peptococcaceae bacterium]|nr:3-hydroxyacyl-CoA dehydrogenase family protein [Peptococcaceae bacterium]